MGPPDPTLAPAPSLLRRHLDRLAAGRSINIRPRPDPHVVKGGAAERSDAVGARQRVDPAAIEEVAIVPKAFADDDAPRRAGGRFRMQPDFAARIAEADDVAFAQIQRRHVVWMHQGAWPDLAGERGCGLVEARIEKVARRRGRELERMR